MSRPPEPVTPFRWTPVLGVFALLVVAGIGAARTRTRQVQAAPAPARARPSTPPLPRRDAGGVQVDPAVLRAQYETALRFAREYVPRCRVSGRRPRVLITAFGPYDDVRENASSAILARLVPGAVAPNIERAPAGGVDRPEDRSAAAVETVDFPGIGRTDVCGVLLPSHWDLPAAMALAEIDAFGPELVLMTGVSKRAREVLLELGSVNLGSSTADDTPAGFRLQPAWQHAPVIEGLDPTQPTHGLLLSWGPVRAAAEEEIRAHAADLEGQVPFATNVRAIWFGHYPRAYNQYLCNDLAFVVDHAMNHPGQRFTLGRAASAMPGQYPSERITVGLQRDLKTVPRVFFHWPSVLRGRHLDAGAAVLRAMITAQLRALRDGTSTPTLGHPGMFEPEAPISAR